jgi:UDP:flavonoid glycosyltransferase YjiC (YdhE family)
MRMLLAVHVGETLGHLIRALPVAERLREAGVEVHVASSSRGAALVEEAGFAHRTLPWGWSHNGITDSTLAAATAAVVRTNQAVLAEIEDLRPDLVIGFPGIFTAQAARAAHVPHLSVVHGVYLSGASRLRTSSAPVARTVVGFGARFFEQQATHVWEALAHELGLPRMTHEQWLTDEALAVADPLVPVDPRPRWSMLPALRSGYGAAPDDLDAEVLAGACVVTFGTGNPCDIDRVVRSAAAAFPTVVVCGGTGVDHPRVIARPALDHRRLAGRVAACISHGGLGTIAAFASAGTPMLLVPTEVDQATTAFHARRAGVALTAGVERWAQAPALGRQLRVDDDELHAQVEALAARGCTPRPSFADDGEGVAHAALASCLTTA